MATPKQKLAVKKMLENIGSGNPKTQGQIMKESGYSDAIAKNPKIITESKGYAELMDEYLPNDYLAKKHKKFLDSAKEEIGVKALDMAYKVKDNYASQKSDLKVSGGLDLKSLIQAADKQRKANEDE